MANSAIHMNGNIMVAIDIETTGLQPHKHDLLQLCILPLDSFYKPRIDVPHFEIKIKPRRPENVDLEAIRKCHLKPLYMEAMLTGIDSWVAIDRLREWVEKLKIPFRKKMVPLGHNYAGLDKPFIMEWLGGPTCYDEFFRSDHRDTMTAALFLNDMADMAVERIQFPKYNLAYLCACLKLEHPNQHDAVGDCIATAEVYRRLLKYWNYYNPLAPSAVEGGDLDMRSEPAPD